MDLLIYNLPNELLNIIFNKLNINIKVLLNKYYYNKYNYILQNNFTFEKYNSLVRDIIRNDYIFVFQHIISENYEKWIKLVKYNYKNVVYENYITYLIYYCNKNSSDKCKNLIYNFLNKCGIKKTLLKNNKVKYNKWIK